jgi:hypothetical protein
MASSQYEITIKEYSSIPLFIELIRKFNVKSVSLTQKLSYINNIKVAEELLKAIPDLHITLTFSIMVNYSSDTCDIETKLLKFLWDGYDIGIKDFLIVTGVPRKLYTSVQALQFLKFQNLPPVNLYCAFNPYLTNYLGKEEVERLRYKFGTKILKGLYFQIGEDTNKLINGIKIAKTLTNNIYGSFLIPSRSILNQLKFKPWHGVKFSESYISNLNNAITVTKKIRSIYLNNNVKPLIELIPFNEITLNNYYKTFPRAELP